MPGRTEVAARRRNRAAETRSPWAALAMALPVAALLAVAFGGWGQFVAQADSVVHLVGH